LYQDSKSLEQVPRTIWKRSEAPVMPWVALLSCYVLAKVLEAQDVTVGHLFGIGGHLLKHLVSAVGLAVFFELGARTCQPDALGVLWG
jgi:hypothetical protein